MFPLLVWIVAYRILNCLLVQTWFEPDEYWQGLEPAHNLAFGFGFHIKFLVYSVMLLQIWLFNLGMAAWPEKLLVSWFRGSDLQDSFLRRTRHQKLGGNHQFSSLCSNCTELF